MAIFPSIKPSARRFTAGEYPTKIYRALSGKTIRRNFGTRPFGYVLELQFDNVNETTVKSIMDHYNTQFGQSEGFALPNEVFAGLSSTVTNLIQAPSNIEWFYSESPSIESVYRNLSTVSVKLAGELT